MSRNTEFGSPGKPGQDRGVSTQCQSSPRSSDSVTPCEIHGGALRMGIALVLSMLLLGACGGTPARRPAQSQATSTAQSPAPTNVATLNCRLPVAGFVPPSPKGRPDSSIGPDGQPNQKGTGGFLDLPSGKYTPASDSDRTYLAGAGVWVPVQPQAVAPDQRSYVVGRAAPSSTNTPPTTTLFLVDVRTPSEHRLFTARDGDMAFVLAYTLDGIYVVTAPSTGGGASELEVIDTATGAHRPVPGSGAATVAAQRPWVAVSGDAAWGMEITNPVGSQSQPSAKLVRLSLRDGSQVVWYDSPGLFEVLGFDATYHPILMTASASSAGPSLALVTGPGQAVIAKVKGGVFQGGRGAGITDKRGTWFGSADGSIWLFTSAGDFEKVGAVPPQPGGSGQPYDPYAWRTIAGPCV